MKTIIQTNEDIPVHIPCVVDAESAKAEELLASLIKPRKITRRTNTAVDLGLTVETPIKSKGQKKEVDVATELSQNQQDLVRSQSNLQPNRPSRTESALGGVECSDDDEDSMMIDQDNTQKDSNGKEIYSFGLKNKSTKSMMKRAGADIGQGTLSGSLAKRAQSNSTKANAENHDNRVRIRKQMESLKDDANSDEDIDDAEEEEDKDNMDIEEEDDEDDEDSGGRLRSKQDNSEAGYDRYFQDLQTSAKTSNNTLSKLAVLNPKEFNDILASAPKKHDIEIKRLLNAHRSYFSQWVFELHSGFNLIFYGYGSKRRLLNDFAQSSLSNGPLIVINGFFPSINIKDILLKITSGALNITCSTGQVLEHAAVICDYFSDDEREFDHLYLVIHNLDGANLRNERAQTVLSMLANSPNIHLIASVDHINAGLLWDNVKASRFNWIWHDGTTYDDYLVETSFENSLLMRSGEMGGVRGVQYVLTSLTSNGRGVFRVLAEHQLVEMEMSSSDGSDNSALGLPYNKYYQLCREGFYVSSDASLRSQLTEFKDHKIIHTKRLPDGTEVFYIPLDKATLTSIVENMA
ncbi:origin recognition complex subunit 2-domain-containing protein [Phycomyces blakesleeanus]